MRIQPPTTPFAFYQFRCSWLAYHLTPLFHFTLFCRCSSLATLEYKFPGTSAAYTARKIHSDADFSLFHFVFFTGFLYLFLTSTWCVWESSGNQRFQCIFHSRFSFHEQLLHEWGLFTLLWFGDWISFRKIISIWELSSNEWLSFFVTIFRVTKKNKK